MSRDTQLPEYFDARFDICNDCFYGDGRCDFPLKPCDCPCHNEYRPRQHEFAAMMRAER